MQTIPDPYPIRPHSLADDTNNRCCDFCDIHFVRPIRIALERGNIGYKNLDEIAEIMQSMDFAQINLFMMKHFKTEDMQSMIKQAELEKKVGL